MESTLSSVTGSSLSLSHAAFVRYPPRQTAPAVLWLFHWALQNIISVFAGWGIINSDALTLLFSRLFPVVLTWNLTAETASLLVNTQQATGFPVLHTHYASMQLLKTGRRAVKED